MKIRSAVQAILLLALSLPALAFAAPASAAEAPCELVPRSKCAGLASLEASLSTAQAGAHPDLSFAFEVKGDLETPENRFGGHEPYALIRDVRFELPPGLIGNPGVLGDAQQCTALELAETARELLDRNVTSSGCPNGSQIGIATIYLADFGQYDEPIYMMQPPGGEVVARLGIIALVSPFYIDATVRTESDYGLNLEIVDSPAAVSLVRSEGVTWGVPAAKAHDEERCTPNEVLHINCIESPPRPPGNRELPFLTNPTRCGVPLSLRVGASTWAEPSRFDFQSAPFPQIEGCDSLPFGPSVVLEPTTHRAGAPTGFEAVETLPAAEGVEVLEPSQARDFHITLPEGVVINPASADGLDVCSEEQVRFGERVAAECPDASKLAEFETLIPALPRKLKGALYLREPEPGNLYRVWAVADDLGAHAKLQGQLEIDEETGQIEAVIEELPQVPMREVNITLKSGLRAPLANPEECGTFAGHYEFTPWSGGAPVFGNVPVRIDEGCSEMGGFDPKLRAGATNPSAGAHTPFVFAITREDGEQNPASLEVKMPRGLAASFAGIPLCEGVAAETGQCPAGSRIGGVIAAAGPGPAPLWVPQPGKRPTAVYLAGPYKGAPLSAVAVVPAQAGPFDLGDQVVRSAIYVDNETAQATVKSDPLPQIIEGVPVRYRAAQVLLDRSDFTLNPTSCAPKTIEATVTSVKGAVAHPSVPFTATNCVRLGFAPQLQARLFGSTRRGAHPRFKAVVRMPQGGANLAGTQVTLPRSEFLDQSHFVTICTRVQFRAHECPAGATYGHVRATSPLFDFPLEGEVLLRSSDRTLPDLVFVLHGPASMPVEVAVVGHVDSVKGALRTTFEEVPDAPVSEVVVEMAGGAKGLLENTEGVCDPKNRMRANFTAQNGRRLMSRPKLQAACKGQHRKHKRHQRHR
jgi:hypothetical protein